jgi:hypothetical protein
MSSGQQSARQQNSNTSSADTKRKMDLFLQAVDQPRDVRIDSGISRLGSDLSSDASKQNTQNTQNTRPAQSINLNDQNGSLLPPLTPPLRGSDTNTGDISSYEQGAGIFQNDTNNRKLQKKPAQSIKSNDQNRSLLPPPPPPSRVSDRNLQKKPALENRSDSRSSAEAQTYHINKQSNVRNIVNKFDNITRTSPENDLYRLLKNEAAKILNYVKQYKANTATTNNVELLFKYYVYFKILSKIVKSNGSKTIDEIVKDKVRKYKYNPIPNILIRDKYIERFNTIIPQNAYSQWFNEIVQKMNDHNNTRETYLNNIRNS